MSLKTKILEDNKRVFMNLDHFASTHTWNGVSFTCVTDEESALKRKNNNVVDIAWDNNTREVIIYVPKADFPGRAEPNEHGVFDSRDMKIMQVNEDLDFYTILLGTKETQQMGSI